MVGNNGNPSYLAPYPPKIWCFHWICVCLPEMSSGRQNSQVLKMPGKPKRGNRTKTNRRTRGKGKVATAGYGFKPNMPKRKKTKGA